MKTVYLVTEGSYSDYSVVAASMDKTIAEKLLSMKRGDDIEEYKLIESEDDLREITYYVVVVDLAGKVVRTEIQRLPAWKKTIANPYIMEYNHLARTMLVVYRSTRSADVALKAARDLLAEFKHEFPEALEEGYTPMKAPGGWRRIRAWEEGLKIRELD